MCKKMKILIFILFLISSPAIAGNLICPKQISKGEGSWPIPESSFTKEAAQVAMRKLNLYLSKGTSDMDSVMIDNQILMVRGYLLKERVKDGVPDAKEEFCEFLKNDAFVQH